MPFPSAFGESQKHYDDIFDDFKRIDQATYGEKKSSDSNYFQNPVSGYYNQNLYGPLITILLVAFAIILICEWFEVIKILLVVYTCVAPLAHNFLKSKQAKIWLHRGVYRMGQ